MCPPSSRGERCSNAGSAGVSSSPMHCGEDWRRLAGSSRSGDWAAVASPMDSPGPCRSSGSGRAMWREEFERRLLGPGPRSRLDDAARPRFRSSGPIQPTDRSVTWSPTSWYDVGDRSSLSTPSTRPTWLNWMIVAGTASNRKPAQRTEQTCTRCSHMRRSTMLTRSPPLWSTRSGMERGQRCTLAEEIVPALSFSLAVAESASSCAVSHSAPPPVHDRTRPGHTAEPTGDRHSYPRRVASSTRPARRRAAPASERELRRSPRTRVPSRVAVSGSASERVAAVATGTWRRPRAKRT